MANLHIRTATRNDFPAIRSLIFAVHINPIGLDWRRFIVVISPQNQLLGCGQIKPHLGGTRELASIAVKSEARRQGIARKIIATLLSLEAKRPVFLMCRAGFHAIKVDEMPPYFKQISRLEQIINSRALPEDRLLVMRLE
jgi:N-acetylglutamate synthase-like GNAT family acetyltransferase